MLFLSIFFCFLSKGYGENSINNGNNVILWNNLKEDDGMYRVPYYFDEDLDNRTRDSAVRAISSLFAQTCIHFDPAEIGDPSVILIQNGSGCSSFIGRKNGVSIIEGCRRYGDMLGALMNALGFPSETLRLDRDQHVVVFLERMKIGKVSTMDPQTSLVQERFNFSYDINSVTHYDSNFQASSDEPTIYDILTGKPVVKNNWAYSLGDLQRVRAVYNCSGVTGVEKTMNCSQRVDNGLLYRGNISVTENGIRCQNWRAQNPHKHLLIPSRLTGSDLVKNWCRNPTVRERPWCFTRNDSVRWDYCDVPFCNTTVNLPTPAPLVSVRGFWTEWSSFTRCSRTCGNGLMYSLRYCIGGRARSEVCPGKYWKHEKCNYRNCTNHEWRQWGKWGECDVMCGSGRHVRVRSCSGLVGLDQCFGDSVENETCHSDQNCPIGECYDADDAQSYNGTEDVDRNGIPCINWVNSKLNISDYPYVNFGGNKCRNPDNRRKSPYCFIQRNKRSMCNVTICNKKARWSKWRDWSSCSESCGEGVMTRIRICRRGQYGDGNCTGEVYMTKACNVTCINNVPVFTAQIRVPPTSPVITVPPSGRECVSYQNPRTYRGTQNRTKSGLPCQEWDAVFPWSHNYSDPDVIVEEGLTENYCRTPELDDTRPWCFVKGFYPTKEDCAVPICPYNSTEQLYFYRLWVSFSEKLGLTPDFVP